MARWTDIGVEPAVRQKNGRVTLIALGPYCLIGILLALVPESLVVAFPALTRPADGLSEFIPGISRRAGISSAPAAMKLFMSVMWTGLPFAAYQIGKRWVIPSQLHAASGWRKAQLFGAFLVMLAILCWFLAFPPDALLEPGGRGAAVQWLMATTAIGLGIFGSLFFACFALVLGIALRLLIDIVTGRRPDLPRHERKL